MLRSRLLLVILTLMMLTLPVAQAGAEKVNITWSTFGNPTDIQRFQEITRRFNEQNPDINVKLIPIPNQGYDQKILTLLMGGNAPDAFYAGDTTIGKMIREGVIAPLTDMLKDPESMARIDQFADGLWGAARKDGEIYGVPVDCNPLLFYYNKKIFRELGLKSPQEYYEEGNWNWETVKMIARKARDAGKVGYVVRTKWWGPIWGWVWTNGGRIFDENGNWIADDKAKEAIKFLDEMIAEGSFVYEGAMPSGQGETTLFMSGQAAMISCGRWLTPTFSQNKSLEFDYVPWPTNTGKQLEPTPIGVSYMAMKKDTPHPEETFRFISYFCSMEGQEFRLAGKGNAVPSIRGVDHLVTDGIPEHAEYLIDAREVGWVTPVKVPGTDWDILDTLDGLFLDVIDFDEAWKEMTERVQDTVAKYRETE